MFTRIFAGAGRAVTVLLVTLLALASFQLATPAHAITISTQAGQWDLAAMGYLGYDDVDGQDGSKTTSALRDFQEDRCLDADGKLGDKTSAELSGVIHAIQVKAGIKDADGQAGPGTKAGIAAWQKAHGLEDDGVAGPLTMSKLGVVREKCTGTAPAPVPGSKGCANGTRDLGMNTGYRNGKPFAVHLCAVSNLPSSDGESNPNSPYYVHGAERDAIIEASLSDNVVNLVTAAKRDGVTLRATSSFRTMRHQVYLRHLYCGDKPGPCRAAQPGYSPHQAGIALDLNTGGDLHLGATCTHNRSTATSPVYHWLVNHAHSFGFHQLAKEAWHWDSDPLNETHC